MSQRNPPARDEAYLAWVRTQPSVISGRMGCEAHHVISKRFSSQKTSDYLAIPLTPDEHRKLHENWPAWEREHGEQRAHSSTVMERAIAIGFPFKRHDEFVPVEVVKTRTRRKSSKTGHANGQNCSRPSKSVPPPWAKDVA